MALRSPRCNLAKTAATATRLLAAGADPSAVDGHGYGTPAGGAGHDGRTDVEQAIRDYAA
jgi:hypothetical protein